MTEKLNFKELSRMSVKELIEVITSKNVDTFRDDKGNTLFMDAIKNIGGVFFRQRDGSVEKADFFRNIGANIEEVNNKGLTSLMLKSSNWLSRDGYSQVRYLLEANAKIDRKFEYFDQVDELNVTGQTVLMSAALNCGAQFIKNDDEKNIDPFKIIVAAVGFLMEKDEAQEVLTTKRSDEMTAGKILERSIGKIEVDLENLYIIENDPRKLEEYNSKNMESMVLRRVNDNREESLFEYEISPLEEVILDYDKVELNYRENLDILDKALDGEFPTIEAVGLNREKMDFIKNSQDSQRADGNKWVSSLGERNGITKGTP